MKSLAIILISLSSFSISCQMSGEDIKTESENVSKTQEANAFINSTPTPKLQQDDMNLKIGIVDGDDGDKDDICFRTKNRNLAENTPVSIVTSFYESSQKVLNAKIEKKLGSSCSRRASESTDKNPGENFYYSLTLTDKEIDEYQEVFGIGVIEPETGFRFQNNMASIDLNNDGKAEFFRRCEGFEGVLFAVWTGKPLKGKQIWHSFYYLDYDTESNCKKKDWKVIDD